MKTSLYAPFLVSLSIQGACLVFVAVAGEPRQNTSRQRYSVIANREPRASFSEEPASPLSSPSTGTTSTSDDSHILAGYGRFFVRSEALLREFQQIATLFDTPASRFCLVAFFFKRIAFASESFMFQYASEKFLWPLRQTTWLRVASAAGAVFATLIAWPVATSILTKSGFPSHKLDLNAVRISLFIVASAFFWAWRATSGKILALGTLQYPLLGVRLSTDED